MTKKWFFEARFVIEPVTIETVRQHCSPSGKFCWVTQRERLRVCTFKGVRGSLIDCLLPDPEQQVGENLVCEVGLKLGSYDGNKRWRVTFRSWPAQAHEGKEPSGLHPGPGSFVIEEEDQHLVFVARWKPAGIWAQSFPQIPYVPSPGSRVEVFFWQWRNWYEFLPREEVVQASEVWLALPLVQTTNDIVVLNRTASSMLYDLARSLGWRKLTLKDKTRLGLTKDAPQWQREENIVTRLASRRSERKLSPTGCGDYTIRSAYGQIRVE